MRVSVSPRWLLALLVVGAVLVASSWRDVSTLPRRPRPRPRPAPPDEWVTAPRLPERYWQLRAARPAAYEQPSCTRPAARADVQLAAPGWQHLRLRNGSVYLYGAYWDDRFAEPLVRVLVYCDVAPLPALLCQLWYPDEGAPQTVRAQAQYGWRAEWGGPAAGVNEPYVLGCRARRPPPDPPAAPLAVSLATRPCQRARNILHVQGAPAPGERAPRLAGGDHPSIAVCLKWVDDRRDVAARLVEWLLLLRAFGADRLYVHVVHAHPNVKKVLQYFAAEGFARVTLLSHPPQLSSASLSPATRDFHDLRRELLPLNDCLYRSLRRHHFLAVIDMDEIIVPVRDGTWPRLVAREAARGQAGEVDALVFANYYLLDGAQRGTAAPPPARMLAHVWRAREPNPPGYNVKSFHNTSSVVALHNHLPLACGARPCAVRHLDRGVARLHHYRERCADDAADCAALHDVVRDDTLTRWAHLRAHALRVLRRLALH